MRWVRWSIGAALMCAAAFTLVSGAWRLPLGSDLRGGLELLLEVRAEDAMAEKVASDVRALRAALPGGAVRAVDGVGFEVELDEDATPVVRGLFGLAYRPVGRQRFELSPRWQGAFRAALDVRAEEQIRERIQAWCPDDLTVEVERPGWIRVSSLPGVDGDSPCGP